MNRFFVASALLALCAACSDPPTSRVALDGEEVISADIKAVDLRTAVDKMTRSLAALPALNKPGTKPVIAFVTVEDRTDENIDGYNLLSNIRKRLLAESSLSVTFVDRADATLDAIDKEQKAKQDGTVTGKPGGALTGADYFLTGFLFRLQRSNVKGVEQYYRLSFRLTDSRTSDVVWEDDYELKRATDF